MIDKTFIPEGDVYRLIIRSKLPAAVRFESFVCDEILPSIRTHGAYIHDDILKKMREDSEYATELIQKLTDEKVRNLNLQTYVEEIEPKAFYYDVILQCPHAVQVSIVAADYGMSAIKFNKLLHALGVQHKVGKTWILYSRHEGKGYTVSKTYKVNGHTVVLTCFTQQGRMWLYELLKRNCIYPKAEIRNLTEGKRKNV
jgi:phage antirepressor YoqD-like protein